VPDKIGGEGGPERAPAERMTDRRSDPVLIHFYRAVVSHMDVWRLRMDATTNWAAVTVAGMITFSFSTVTAPHYVLLLALVFQFVFLLMESRRYQTFDLWRRRFRVLNRALIVPALDETRSMESGEAELQKLARDLGRTVPHLSLAHAAGYRIRRNYGYLFGLTLLAWVLKLEVHPQPAHSALVLLGRASIAFVPGWLVLGAVFIAVGTLLVIAVTAPTSDMLDWEAHSPGWQRWLRRGPGEGGRDVE
jgi:uncharacterized membrane protein